MSRQFYTRLANLVSHAETKETFQYLAKEEQEHKNFLESCFTATRLQAGGAAPGCPSGGTFGGPGLHRELVPQGSPGHRHEAGRGLAYRFYQALAALQPPGETRNFLEKMAQVELSHKEKMEYLYDNTAFPEVWYES